MLWQLFITFFFIGLVSFGGGYAMIPLIQEEVVYQHVWMTPQQFTDTIAVAAMAPGPIATNSAIFVGYDQQGLLGAAVAAFGMTLPSLLLIIVIGALFYKLQKHPWFRSAFYGLRAIITALIIYAAIAFAMSNQMITSFSWQTLSLVMIYGASLLALIRFKIHPVYVILGSGLVGVAFYS